MRVVIALVLIIAALALIGWIRFSSNGQQATITIDAEKAEQETRNALQKGGEALDKAGQSVREGIKDIREDVHQKTESDEPAHDPEETQVPAR